MLDIDYSEVGLSSDELNDILAISAVDANSISESLDELLLRTDFDDIENPITEDTPLSYEEKKEHMKAIKQQVKESASQRQQDENAYIILSFSSFEAKSDFCDLFGISADEKFAKEKMS